MKMVYRSMLVVALFASIAGVPSATLGAVATEKTAAAPVHNVTGCCWVVFGGRMLCQPC